VPHPSVFCLGGSFSTHIAKAMAKLSLSLLQFGSYRDLPTRYR